MSASVFLYYNMRQQICQSEIYVEITTKRRKIKGSHLAVLVVFRLFKIVCIKIS